MAKLDNFNILVVEDDPTIRLLVKKALEHHGAKIQEASTAKIGRELALTSNLDIIILDLRLPDGNGNDISIRANGVKTPVLILSADHDTDIKVRNLNAGADDYLTKPFSIEELLARIEAIMRRSTSTEGVIELECQDLRIDMIKRTITVKNNEVELTNSEFNLLVYLVKNKGREISLEELAENVWGIGFDTQTNYINVYVSYLRKKLRKYSDVQFIQTVRKKGFKAVCE